MRITVERSIRIDDPIAAIQATVAIAKDQFDLTTIEKLEAEPSIVPNLWRVTVEGTRKEDS